MANNNGKAFADKLVALRGKRTQKEVAKAIGISFSSYQKYEMGLRVPRDEVKVKLAEYFNTTVGYIFFK